MHNNNTTRKRIALLVEVDLDPAGYGTCSTQESWVDVLEGTLIQWMPHYNPKVEPVVPCSAKPKLRIKWGNVASYLSLLALVALLLWMLIEMTNTNAATAQPASRPAYLAGWTDATAYGEPGCLINPSDTLIVCPRGRSYVAPALRRAAHARPGRHFRVTFDK